MTVELYKKYRPSSLDELIGQDDVIDMIEAMIENSSIPHCILASGPSGCGKTTTFRILRKLLKCSDMDFKEINAADFRGVDMVRDVRQSLGLSPINGTCKIWLIDECHSLTSAASESFLKILEDTPSHVYFFLASTDPQKLKKTIITRSTHLQFKLLSESELKALVEAVYNRETDRELPSSIAKKIAEVSEGSARKALVLLHQVIDLDPEDNEDKALDVLMSTEVQRQAIEICRALLRKSTTWYDMASLLKEVDEDPEKIRVMVLGYMSSVALSGKKGVSGRAVSIIELFQDNFYDSKKAGLIAACYEAVEG